MIKLTQERLNEIDIVGERGFYHHTGTGLSAPQARVKSIIEEATGEKVTIVEPEPEIPEAAIESAAAAICESPACCPIPELHKSAARRALGAAWDNGWGGLRK